MTIFTSISTTCSTLLSLRGAVHAFEVVLAVTIIYAVYSVVYNIFFHPLRHIPGPFFARACGLPFALHIRNGSVVKWIKACHDKYGEAVRLEPNEVSFISGETAWQDIYGLKTGKDKTQVYSKDMKWFPPPVNGARSLLMSDEEGHARMRRSLSHAFSEKALRAQEGLIQSYVDLLVQRLGEHAAEDKEVDLRTWYNFTTFDIVSDLAFGEPLYCLRDSIEHKWISITVRGLTAIALHVSRSKSLFFRSLDKLRSFFTDNSGPARARLELAVRARDMVTKRLRKIESGEENARADFFSYIIKNQEKETTRLTRAEMDSNAVSFLLAGTETSATALAGTTFLLLRNPTAYRKLVTEIRSRFSSADQISVDEVGKLDYLVAVLHEGMRYYPPAATGLARVVPAGGDVISGRYIPGGATVYISMPATGRSARNFRDPDEFVPERWLGDERFEGDRRAAHQPFSFGPRNCIGKTLAYAETRLILAKILFAYDLELVDKERDWIGEQKVYGLWTKGPLMVRVKPAQQP